MDWPNFQAWISIIIGISSFLIALYQLSRKDPHPLSARLFLCGTVLALLFCAALTWRTGSKTDGKAIPIPHSTAPPVPQTRPITPGHTTATANGGPYITSFFHSQALEGAVWRVDGVKTEPDQSTLSLTNVMVPKGFHEVTATYNGQVFSTRIQAPVPSDRQPITLTRRMN